MVCVTRRSGATKVEYALMLMLLSITCILVVGMLGQSVGGLFNGAILPGAAVAPAPAGATDEPSADDGGGGKGKKGGNPNGGNNGNDKPVGNAPG